MLCFVPIYGTKGAGRSLLRKIRRVLLGLRFAENHIFNALHSLTITDAVVILVAEKIKNNRTSDTVNLRYNSLTTSLLK